MSLREARTGLECGFRKVTYNTFAFCILCPMCCWITSTDCYYVFGNNPRKVAGSNPSVRSTSFGSEVEVTVAPITVGSLDRAADRISPPRTFVSESCAVLNNF